MRVNRYDEIKESEGRCEEGDEEEGKQNKNRRKVKEMTGRRGM